MALTIQDLGSLGEFFGSIAVLATLVYLALQTRQNTMAIGAQLDSTSIGAMQNSLLTAATSDKLIDALVNDYGDDNSAEDWRKFWFWTAYLTQIQWQFLQARRGLLPSFRQTEAGFASGIRDLFRFSGTFEQWWRNASSDYSPEFVEWVEEQRSKAA